MKKVLIISAATIGLAAVAFGGWYLYRLNQEKNARTLDRCTESLGKVRCHPVSAKPVIYLYPTKTSKVDVTLKTPGKLLHTYPEYQDGWEVVARPDGTLNHGGKEYNYLFWEAEDNLEYKMESGFVVKGGDTKAFLEEKLAQIGLTPREYNEMIVYWFPKLETNKYNLIHFAGLEYADRNQLLISPKPDSLLRVYMVTKPLDKYIDIPAQKITPFQRKGFAVVEWGGRELQ